MGIIKEGTISGNLPTKEAFAVHYPAYASSVDRAVETLGGLEAIAKAHSSESNKLELHFRPEDPYSHPAFGEFDQCNHFLLRICNNKVSNAPPVTFEQKQSYCELIDATQPITGPDTENSAPSAEVKSQVPEEGHLSADIVARIPEAYHFNGMVDYQHVLAVHADVARRKKRNWAEFEKGGLMDVDQEDLMILVPPLFSLKDMPKNLVLKPCQGISLKRNQEGVFQHNWEMDIEPSLKLDFSIKEIPKKVNWENYIPEDSEQWVWQKTVCELFEERPIWIKASLSERLLDKGLELGGDMLRRLLFRAAYYFSNGPFLGFWIRKGYDPRKDPESRIYQRMGFLVPVPLRSYCDTNAASGLKHPWKDICAFRAFPYKCHTSLQLFELDDKYIQEEIRKPSNAATCSSVTGWLSCHVLDSLRHCIAVRFLSVYPTAGAESLLKLASGRFEKSKRIRLYPNNLEVNEEKEQANIEVVENQEKEPNDEEEDEEDEDDNNEDDNIEDDNIEEDLDAYEAVDPIGTQEGYLSLQKHSYTDNENMSRNYLQDLFGNFPFNAAGDNEIPDANISDGEYPIYEQYSDGNYTDNDDY